MGPKTLGFEPIFSSSTVRLLQLKAKEVFQLADIRCVIIIGRMGGHLPRVLCAHTLRIRMG